MPNQNHSSSRSKLRAFIIAETMAVSIVFLAGALVLSAGPVKSTFVTALNVVMFAAGLGVVALPIFFFALAPILPRSGR